LDEHSYTPLVPFVPGLWCDLISSDLRLEARDVGFRRVTTAVELPSPGEGVSTIGNVGNHEVSGTERFVSVFAELRALLESLVVDLALDVGIALRHRLEHDFAVVGDSQPGLVILHVESIESVGDLSTARVAIASISNVVLRRPRKGDPLASLVVSHRKVSGSELVVDECVALPVGCLVKHLVEALVHTEWGLVRRHDIAGTSLPRSHMPKALAVVVVVSVTPIIGALDPTMGFHRSRREQNI